MCHCGYAAALQLYRCCTAMAMLQISQKQEVEGELERQYKRSLRVGAGRQPAAQQALQPSFQRKLGHTPRLLCADRVYSIDVDDRAWLRHGLRCCQPCPQLVSAGLTGTTVPARCCHLQAVKKLLKKQGDCDGRLQIIRCATKQGLRQL